MSLPIEGDRGNRPLKLKPIEPIPCPGLQLLANQAAAVALREQVFFSRREGVPLDQPKREWSQVEIDAALALLNVAGAHKD